MALRRILNNHFKLALNKQQQLRGGHGWDRPDVPLSLNPIYVHKREISIFDNNMWAYDQVYPEYMITYSEMYVRDEWGALKEILYNSTYIVFTLGLIGMFYYFNANYRVGGLDTNSSDSLLLGDFFKQYEKRSATRPNFLRLSCTTENARIYAEYDKNGFLYENFQSNIENINQRKRVNQEAKNFVQKVRKEAIDKVKNGNMEHQHGHH
ncbi:hypothetical protein IMG5_115520 [Ichthyophthirius multifiliis]|uniref:Transmembrane protein n=1 Tax=Ichthyophthirius multifiliis TaxID=5932 RepID=G0QU82_ICHMU|nr:hypothetical protein IMG5_115520 [Ichthyophthirius multifiliis]EGR31219.1 hypothetical protein IMG5_115520 [Ichthyophthirius multifiliis]|eukprot:XP_004034705.1 hypothetical protein IMG5_115520 [Ichthyophthirius multifiliis]